MKKLNLIVMSALLVFLLTGCSNKVEDKEQDILIDDTSVNVLFTGTLENKLPNGEGSFTASTKETKWNASGTFENGVFVKGEIYNMPMVIKINNLDYEGIFNGTLDQKKLFSGQLNFINGDITYTGNILNGSFSGQGSVTNLPYTIEHDGKTIDGIYTGEIKEKLPSGKGEFIDGNAFFYEGNFLDGTFGEEGYLKDDQYVVHFLHIDRAGKYEGEVYNGIASGTGKFNATNSDGDNYEYTGEWKNGLFNGQGSQIWEDEETFDPIGTFTDGEFTPTLPEAFVSFGGFSNFPYEVTEMANEFLINNEKIFLRQNTPDQLDVLTDPEFEYKHYIKNPSKFGDKLVLKKLTIVQINEFYISNDVYSYIIAYDNKNNIYFMYYLGECSDIYAESKVTAYFLPLAYSSYENLEGTIRKAIACAGASIALN